MQLNNIKNLEKAIKEEKEIINQPRDFYLSITNDIKQLEKIEDIDWIVYTDDLKITPNPIIVVFLAQKIGLNITINDFDEMIRITF